MGDQMMEMESQRFESIFFNNLSTFVSSIQTYSGTFESVDKGSTQKSGRECLKFALDNLNEELTYFHRNHTSQSFIDALQHHFQQAYAKHDSFLSLHLTQIDLMIDMISNREKLKQDRYKEMILARLANSERVLYFYYRLSSEATHKENSKYLEFLGDKISYEYIATPYRQEAKLFHSLEKNK